MVCVWVCVERWGTEVSPFVFLFPPTHTHPHSHYSPSAPPFQDLCLAKPSLLPLGDVQELAVKSLDRTKSGLLDLRQKKSTSVQRGAP